MSLRCSSGFGASGGGWASNVGNGVAAAGFSNASASPMCAASAGASALGVGAGCPCVSGNGRRVPRPAAGVAYGAPAPVGRPTKDLQKD